MKEGPRKEAVKSFLVNINALKMATVELGVIQHILREHKQDEPQAVQDAFRVIHGALSDRMAYHYETLFGWAITQPEEIQDLVKPMVEERWGRKFRELAKLYGWEVEE